jgi:hypothetical protein
MIRQDEGGPARLRRRPAHDDAHPDKTEQQAMENDRYALGKAPVGAHGQDLQEQEKSGGQGENQEASADADGLHRFLMPFPSKGTA